MKTLKSVVMTLTLALLVVTASFATDPTYSQSVSGSSFTIYSSNSGFVTPYVGFSLKDGSGNPIRRSTFTAYSDAITPYSFHFSGLASNFSGTATLVNIGGSGAPALTSNSSDFLVAIDSNTSKVDIGYAADQSRYDSANSRYLYSASQGTVTINSGAPGTVYFWFDADGWLMVGTSGYSASLTSSMKMFGTVVGGVSSYPAGSTPLAHCSTSNGAFSSCTDDRTF